MGNVRVASHNFGTMKTFTTTLVVLLASSSCVGAHVRGGGDENNNRNIAESTSERQLSGGCNGPSLPVEGKLHGDESICGVINDEMVYFGLRTYENNPEQGYTFYQVELWSQYGTHSRTFQGIGQPSSSPAPFIQLQGDGHLVFSGNSASGDCLAKPGTRGPAIEARIEGPLPDYLKVFDNNGDVVFTLTQMTLSNGNTYISGSACYPETPPKCVNVLRERNRLTWNEYVCEFDSSGNAVSRFGLDSHGLLGLWTNNGEPKWRPGPDHVRGDYLHLQGDGHLTLYRDTKPNFTYTWKSRCSGDGTKIAISDGDVHQFNENGSVAWTIAGDEPEPVCRPGCAL